MERLAQVCDMLSDKNRLRILKLLQYKPMCVCELTYILGIRQPSVSRHLRKLKESHLIENCQEGLWNEYFIHKDGDEYTQIFINHLNDWLNRDPVVIEDIQKAGQICRELVCKENRQNRCRSKCH